LFTANKAIKYVPACGLHRTPLSGRRLLLALGTTKRVRVDSEKIREICAHLESTAEMIGFELQPRVSSCDALESIVLGLSELDEAGPFSGAVFMCGVYLGEIIRTEVGGDWAYSDQTTQYCLGVAGRQYFPIEQVRDYVEMPAEKELLFYAQAAISKSSA